MEELEQRLNFTAYLFIDYGDNFPGGTLSTTQGAFRDVAGAPAVGNDRILGTPLPDAGGFTFAGGLDIVAQPFTAQERAQILAVVQRAYEPLDVTVVDLTANTQFTADGRAVQAATNMQDVIDTLRGGDPTARDAYIFVATFIADPGGANELTYTGGGGLSPSNTLGETSDLNAAANNHDDVAVVYSNGGFSFNTVNNIAHEAGHNFGLRHAITGDPATPAISLFHQLEIMSYQNTNNTSSSTFTRYPMIRGDGNTPVDGADPLDYNDLSARNGNVTIYDQVRNDANVGQNPNFDFITGTGAHDIVNLTRNGAFIDVTVQAFANGDFTGPITVPGEADTTYSYSIAAGLPIRLYAGGSNDRIVINGDLGVNLFIDGMQGVDEIVVNALGANVTYTPDPTSLPSVDITGLVNDTSFGGLLVGGSSISFNDFEVTSNLTINAAGGTVTYVTPGVGNDDLTLSNNAAGNPEIAGSVDFGNTVIPLEIIGATRIAIQTGLADDTLTVDSGNGLIGPVTNYDGGGGFDRLNVTQTGGPTRNNSFVIPAANPGDGQSIVEHGAVQFVQFFNIEPIVDNVPAAAFSLNTTPGIASLLDMNNAVNYSTGVLLPTGGRITVDNFEPIEFENKTAVFMVVGNGDDVVNLNNPNTPTGLTSITAVGGDSGLGDTVVLNGRAGLQDQMRLAPAAGGGLVTQTGRPSITIATAENLRVVLDPLASDHFTVDGTAGNDTFRITDGPNIGEQVITGEFNSAAPFLLPTIHVTGQSNALIGTLNFAGVGGNDTLIVTGTNTNDTFNLNRATATSGNIDHDVNGIQTGFIGFANFTTIVVEGGDGDDNFNLPGNFPTNVQLLGGNPSGGSDTVTINGAGAAITVDLQAETVQETGFALVTLSGVEDLVVNGGVGAITVNGTTAPDKLTVSPTAANDATIELEDDDLTVFTSNTGALNVNLLAGGNNELTVEGTAAAETVTVTGLLVTVGALKTVNYSNATSLRVLGEAGADTFNVTTAAGISMFIDGGDPIGTTGDRLNITTGGAFIVQPGPEKDEGGVASGTARVSWDHIEEVSVTGGPALILGTNGDDDITVIARDVSTHAGTDGVRDFTVTVNDTFSMLFINQATLAIDALAGDDDIVVRAPAPNGAEWDVDITVGGGPAASPTTDQGDTLEFETPGAITAVIFTPTGPDTGTFTLDQAVNDSVITMVNTFIFDPAGANEYTFSPGGIEHVVYDGVTNLANDVLTINGTDTNDTLTFDESLSGTFRSPLSPTFDFSLTSVVTLNGGTGFDTANLLGSAGNDSVTSTATVVTLLSPASVATLTIGTSVELFNLSTLGGSDNIDLDLNVVGLQKSVDAGAGDDIVNLSGTIDATIIGGDGDDFLTGSPAYDLIFGGAGNDFIFGVGGNDDINGGEGSDLLVGGAGADRVFGNDGSDTLVWNPGDGNDLFEGGEGRDVLQFVGGAAADTFTVSANGTRLRFDRSPPAVPGQIIIDAAGMEQVDVNTSISFGGTLSGAEEVPPVATAATGRAALVFNAATGTFELEVLVQGITLAQLSDSHLHSGAAGVNGPVIFPMGTAGWSDVGGAIRRVVNLGTFPVANIADLLAGNVYVNIHTIVNPGGEIRGQLTAVSGAPNLNGADTFVVNDLFATEVTTVNLGLGNADAAAVDSVTVNGRTTADDLNITAPNDTLQSHVLVAGLRYDVHVFGAIAADTDRLTVNGNDGNDIIKAAALVENTVLITLNGNDGNDILSADAIINGGNGDDILTGGAGIDTINGNAGNDTITGGAAADIIDGGAGEDTIFVDLDGANDSITGGTEYDTIVLLGTSASDVLAANQTAAGTLVTNRNGTADSDTIATIERVLIEAGAGDDTIFVQHLDGLKIDAPTNNSVLFQVNGGAAWTADRLVVQDNGASDVMIYRRSGEPANGSVTVAPLDAGTSTESLNTVFENIEYVDPRTTNANNIFVFKYDPFEWNGNLQNATHLGAGTLNVDPVIDPGIPAIALPPGFPALPGADEDFYRIEAEVTGTLDVQAFFRHNALLPGNGDIDIELYDAAGVLMVSDLDVDDDARVRIPAVEGQIYFLRVFQGTPDAINTYSLTVINEAAPTPFGLELTDTLVILGGDPNRTGTANFTYNAAANTFNIDLFVAGVELVNTTPQPQLGQVSIQTAGGVVIVNIPTATAIQEPNGVRLTLNNVAFSAVAANITALQNGSLFVDVDYAAPAGSIRGQITSDAVFGVSDSGRSQFDNVTNDATPTFFVRVGDGELLNDVPDNGGGPGLPVDGDIISILHNTTTTINATGAGFRVAIFLSEVDTNGGLFVGYAQPVLQASGLYQFTLPAGLLVRDGSWFVSSRIEMIDPGSAAVEAQGFGAFSDPFEFVLDTSIPPAVFGLADNALDGLHPSSDTGVPGFPASFSDGLTSDTTPTFWGSAESNAIIRLFVDSPLGGTLGVFDPGIDQQIGMTVAQAYDGTNASPNGNWQITSQIDMNNPLYFPVQDGLRTIFMTAEDLPGNLNPAAGGVQVIQTLTFGLDTLGPQVTDVDINTAANPFDLFNPKPVPNGPTPVTNSIVISFQDFIGSAFPFPNGALDPLVALNPGNYNLRGDFSGNIPIANVALNLLNPVAPVPGPAQGAVPNPNVFTATVTLTFFNPLPDDRFTLTVKDNLLDQAGNKLDGNTNALEPLPGTGILGIDGDTDPLAIPSGDLVPGESFVARFTIDTRPEVGVWATASAWVDLNGNRSFDPTNVDFVNRDVIYQFGTVNDHMFAGNFTALPLGATDGWDKIASYGLINGQYRFLIDTDNDGVPNINASSAANPNGVPVAGNFNGFAGDGDEVAVFTGTSWSFDTDHNFNVGNFVLTSTLRGSPIVGDVDGDGFEDLGTYQNDTWTFDLSSVGATLNANLPGLDGATDISFNWGLIGSRERPVAADMNMDGFDDIGLWQPDREGVTPDEGAEWYWLISGVVANNDGGGFIGPQVVGGAFDRVVFDAAAGRNTVRYTPTPFGNDLYFQYGDEFSLPIVGNFDPPPINPVTQTNGRNPYDVDGNNSIDAQDVLYTIVAYNRFNRGVSYDEATAGMYPDVDHDGMLTPQDILYTIRAYMNENQSGAGESAAEGESAAQAADDIFGDDELADDLYFGSF